MLAALRIRALLRLGRDEEARALRRRLGAVPDDEASRTIVAVLERELRGERVGVCQMVTARETCEARR